MLLHHAARYSYGPLLTAATMDKLQKEVGTSPGAPIGPIVNMRHTTATFGTIHCIESVVPNLWYAYSLRYAVDRLGDKGK
jgi:hypothetical protein